MSLQVAVEERTPEGLDNCNSGSDCSDTECNPLPDTQPTDSECTEPLVDDNEEDVWGKLYPSNYYNLRTRGKVTKT